MEKINLAPGAVCSKSFRLVKKIESLDEFWAALDAGPSIFANGKVRPTAFFFSWHIRLVKIWIDRGWFWWIDRI